MAPWEQDPELVVRLSQGSWKILKHPQVFECQLHSWKAFCMNGYGKSTHGQVPGLYSEPQPGAFLQGQEELSLSFPEKGQYSPGPQTQSFEICI